MQNEVLLEFATKKVMEALFLRFPFLRVQIAYNFAIIVVRQIVKMVLVETKLIYLEFKKKEDRVNFEAAVNRYKNAKELGQGERIYEEELVDNFKRFVRFG